jgi:PEGA domain
VELRYPGYPPHQREVTLKRGDQVTVKHAFVPGMLVFRVTPGGTLFVNGKPRGKLPDLQKLELMPGRYAIEVRYLTFQPYTRTIEVKPGQQVVIEHEFKNFLQRFLGK